MQTSRYNIYTFIHKGLRAALCQTLVELGRVDDTDDQAVAAILTHLANLLQICRGHLQHEDQFIHHAIHKIRPQLSLTTVTDHVDHEQHIAQLTQQIQDIHPVAAGLRSERLLNLYRDFALFTAENFEHMHVEETHNAQILWSCFSDDEIHHIEQSIVDSLPPDENQQVLSMVLPNLSHPERTQLLTGMQRVMPSAIFSSVLDFLQQQLSAKDWLKLSVALPVSMTDLNNTAA